MVNRPDSKKARQKRHTRVRAKISGTAECPRLNVFRSLQQSSDMGMTPAASFYKSILGFNIIVTVNAIEKRIDADYAKF